MSRIDIVIIDNDTALLRSLELQLMARGHRVRCFEKPVLALQALAAEPAQVLIVDLVMPELGGLEFMKRLIIRGAKPQRAILVSGHTDLVEGLDLEQSGFQLFLSKPLDGEALIRMVEGAGQPQSKKGRTNET